MDLLSDSECTYCKAKEMLQTARQPKPGGRSSILERWHDDDEHRKSLSLIEWTEQKRIEHDKIAFEDHSYVATRAERIQNSKHWILKLNQDGAQRPLNQRPDFAQVKRECKRLLYEWVFCSHFSSLERIQFLWRERERVSWGFFFFGARWIFSFERVEFYFSLQRVVIVFLVLRVLSLIFSWECFLERERKLSFFSFLLSGSSFFWMRESFFLVSVLRFLFLW